MFSPFERMVAMRYLRARRAEGFISVIAGFSLLGIALGVGTLIVVLAVMNGFSDELQGRLLASNGHINLLTQDPSGLADYDMVAARVQALPGVERVTPLVEGQVMVQGPEGSAGAVVRGMTPQHLRLRPLLATSIRAGDLDDLGGTDTVVIGTRMAQRLGLDVNDRITLISPKGQATIMGTVPRVKDYRVVALFELGLYTYDDSFLFLPLEESQRFFQMERWVPQGEQGQGGSLRGPGVGVPLGAGPGQMTPTVTALEVVLRDPNAVKRYDGLIRGTVDADIYTRNWQETNSRFFGIVKMQRNVVSLILAMIILVAAFNIISGMIMLVKDKGRAIAILRTMGASRGMVMRIFFLSGASIGIIGTVLGLGLGVAFAYYIEHIRLFMERVTGATIFDPEIYYLSELPAIIQWQDVTAVCCVALAISLIMTLFPAFRAARLDPVEALRYE